MTRELRLRDWLMLCIVCLGLFAPGVVRLPPTDRDESRYVVTSQRMADTGDIVDLRFQDQPRYLQPAGIYWLQAASAAVFDSPAHDSIWAYRIPSVLGALIASLLTGWIGARFFGRKAGLAAALLIAACFSLNFEARIAKIDAALLAVIVLAQLALMRLYMEASPSRAVAALFWAAIGIGLMLKGPVVLIFVGGTIAALLIWDRSLELIGKLRPAWGPLVMLAIAAPWFIAIGVITDGEFYTRALVRNFLGKVGQGEQGHDGPPGYHLALFALAFWPGSLLALKAAGFAWRLRAERAVRFLVCWIAPGWIAFELVATKLPHYVLPTYPAIACLAAAALFDTQAPTSRGWARIALFGAAALWLAVSALAAALAPGLLWWSERHVDTFSIALAALAFAAAAAGLLLLVRKRALECAGALALAAALAFGNLFAYAAPRLDSMWMSPRIDAMARATMPCAGGVLVSTPYSEPSLIFLYGRERTRITASGAEAALALNEAAPCGLALVDVQESGAFLARAAELGLAPEAVGRLSGRNYSNGRNLDLTLYSAARERLHAQH